jgi:hypothetical protein
MIRNVTKVKQTTARAAKAAENCVMRRNMYNMQPY